MIFHAQGTCDCLEGPSETVTDMSTGTVICKGCGVVCEANLFDDRPEWFGEDPRTRASVASQDDIILGVMARTMVTSNKRQKYAEPDTTKNTRLGFAEIEKLAGVMHLASGHHIVQTAKEMYRDFGEVRKIREDARRSYAACALYFGCKSHERAMDRNPRTLREIEGLCSLDLHDAVKTFRSALAGKPYAKFMFKTVEGADLLVRKMDQVAGACKLSRAQHNNVLSRARWLLELVRHHDAMEGRYPEAVCGAVMFQACEDVIPGVKVTKTVVYKAAGISGVTLTNALNDLKDLLAETVHEPAQFAAS